MLTPILVVYVAGQIFTAVVLMGAHQRHDRLVNAAGILFWPLYWSYFLTVLFLNRKRS